MKLNLDLIGTKNISDLLRDIKVSVVGDDFLDYRMEDHCLVLIFLNGKALIVNPSLEHISVSSVVKDGMLDNSCSDEHGILTKKGLVDPSKVEPFLSPEIEDYLKNYLYDRGILRN